MTSLHLTLHHSNGPHQAEDRWRETPEAHARHDTTAGFDCLTLQLWSNLTQHVWILDGRQNHRCLLIIVAATASAVELVGMEEMPCVMILSQGH